MKRRVIAIAVVLAAVGVVWQCETLWRPVMLKKVLDTSEPGIIELKWVWRWGGQRYGHFWVWHDGNVAFIDYPRRFTVSWDSDGEVKTQSRAGARGEPEGRTSPPWWPHPPLVDLREFEE